MQSKPSWLKIFTIDFIIATLLFVISLILFSIIADQIVLTKKDWFDARAFAFMDRFSSPSHTKIALFITKLGTGIFLIPCYILVLLYLIIQKRKNTALIIGTVVSLSLLLNVLLKKAFQRPRPLLPHLDYVIGYSFPSGHTMAAFTLSGIVIYLLWYLPFNKFVSIIFSVLAFALACLIGLSRIYLHVHFASDVLGGFFVIAMWLSLCFIILRIVNHRQESDKQRLAG